MSDPVDFSDVQVRDDIRFVTDDSGWGGSGECWRTGNVVKVTATSVMVICDNRTRAILSVANWNARKPQLVARGGDQP
ncbi:hypothetical protein [Streptomyces colonosanans]|uniref:Uncharacterized protein n=1 Tax=Streptomyces colonosanans TaxID=1428652 RepID=A0A1S2Q6S3_9ACTN|nr:hypothetical protein [Streptomyces colonosanans]OIK01397.1 hypothetical protein BIV24_01190 [Streptomyces colonosanans]